jgi:hypothetical protein
MGSPSEKVSNHNPSTQTMVLAVSTNPILDANDNCTKAGGDPQSSLVLEEPTTYVWRHSRGQKP